LILDAQGNLYGTTVEGGQFSLGNVYKLTPGRKMIDVYSFGPNGSAGQNPQGAIVRDAAGSIYGTTMYGPTNGCSGSGCGTIFKVSKNGKHTMLFAFPDSGDDGLIPETGVVLVPSGKLYGITAEGGASANGVVYEFTP
jgi:uncharacterized repeat protein (TIGR03803 family)